MAEKIKFKPEITRIRLNPEQAVIACSCYNAGQVAGLTTCLKTSTVCDGESKVTRSAKYSGSAVSS